MQYASIIRTNEYNSRKNYYFCNPGIENIRKAKEEWIEKYKRKNNPLIKRNF